MKRSDAAPAGAANSGIPEPLRQSIKILVLTPQLPYPPQQGTTIRNYNLIAGLAQRHEVHLLSFGDPDEVGRSTPLGELCRSVQAVPAPQRSTGQRLKGLVFSRLPDMAQRLPSVEFETALAALLDREDFDVVEVEGIELAQYLAQVARKRGDERRPLLVFDEHNAEYILQQRAFETDVRIPRRWIGAAYSFVQWQRLRGYERRACLAADRVVAVSETDAGALRRLVPGLEPVVVPNGVDMAYYTPAVPGLANQAGPGAGDVVFTGKMDFRPNVDAVLWFARQVLPLVRREAAEVRFWIVGKDPHPRLASLASDPAIVLTGRVDDVRPFIGAAGVYVIPLRIGGGTRLKVLEAMAMGKAIVSTALGCEGFDLVPGQELVVASEPAEFAAAILDLLRNPEHRERLGRAARRFAGSRYDWRIIVPRLERVYDA
jgi:sugar transferase (PEP-CTERM/EpsH1 system associated)